MADPPPFDPNKPYTTGSSGPPKFDPSKPYTTSQPTPEQPDVLGTQRGGRSLDIMPVVRGARDFVEAIPQSVLGIPESIYQFGEHAFGLPRPGPWADPLRRYQQQSESTWPGLVGEVVGGIPGFAAGGAVADALGLGSRVAKVITSPAVRTQIASTLGSIFSQPSQGDDYWTQLGERGGLGYLLGRWLGRPTQQAAHNVAEATNASRTAQEVYEADLVKKLNAQQVQQFKADTAADRAAHQTQIANALTQRQAQLDARSAVPASTTGGWWDRTLAQIGVKDPSVTRAGPATGAKVRDIVGGRRNEIIGRMELNSSDPAFTEQINTIRDETLRDLPESAQTKFYKRPPEQDLVSPIIDPRTGKPFPRATPAILGAPGKATGDWVRTVEEPLAKGNLTKKDLSDYISRLGARAEELARDAARVPQDQRAELYAMSNAYRQVADAVVGHAAGSPEDKLALETANRAYTMWSIGNDAALASRGGVASPDQLITSARRRLGGEARYEQALNNPNSPYHDLTNWLQAQRDAHRAQVPSGAQVRGGVTPPTPRPPPIPHQPPPPYLRERVPPEPRRPQRNIPLGLTKGAIAAALYALDHPIWATGTAVHGLTDIIGHGTGGKEKLVERGVRYLLENYPGVAGRVATPAAASTAGGTQRAIPDRPRRAVEKIPQAVGKKAEDMFYKWASPQ